MTGLTGPAGLQGPAGTPPPVIFWAGGPAADNAVNGTPIDIPLDVVETDTASEHLTVNASGLVTVLEAGWYEIEAKTFQNHGGIGNLYFYKNGALVEDVYSQHSSTNWETKRLHRIEYLPVDDTFKFVAKIQFGGSNFRKTTDAFGTRIQIRYLGNAPVPD